MQVDAVVAVRAILCAFFQTQKKPELAIWVYLLDQHCKLPTACWHLPYRPLPEMVEIACVEYLFITDPDEVKRIQDALLVM